MLQKGIIADYRNERSGTMGLTRLDDAEYARRARERNNRVNAAHRQRLLEAGKAQTNVWLSAELRAQLDRLAVADGVNLSAVVERLLSAALNQDSTDFNPVAPAEPAFDLIPPSVDSALDRDATIIAAHSAGLSLAQISGKLAMLGILSANSCPVSVSTINRVLSANGLKANGDLKGIHLTDHD